MEARETSIPSHKVVFLFIVNPQKRDRDEGYHRVMNEINQTTNQIYAYLSQPEHAALKTSLLNGSLKFGSATIGPELIKEMNLPIRHGPNFYDSMNYALARIRKNEANQSTPAPAAGPIFDVILTSTGPMPMATAALIKDVAEIDASAARAMLDGLPATILTGVDQIKAKLAQDAVQKFGAEVNVIAVEAQD